MESFPYYIFNNRNIENWEEPEYISAPMTNMWTAKHYVKIMHNKLIQLRNRYVSAERYVILR